MGEEKHVEARMTALTVHHSTTKLSKTRLKRMVADLAIRVDAGPKITVSVVKIEAGTPFLGREEILMDISRHFEKAPRVAIFGFDGLGIDSRPRSKEED